MLSDAAARSLTFRQKDNALPPFANLAVKSIGDRIKDGVCAKDGLKILNQLLRPIPTKSSRSSSVSEPEDTVGSRKVVSASEGKSFGLLSAGGIMDF